MQVSHATVQLQTHKHTDTQIEIMEPCEPGKSSDCRITAVAQKTLDFAHTEFMGGQRFVE
jgi:hypothetical protein